MPFSTAALLLCLAGILAGAEPTTPRAAVDALTMTGAVAIAPDQIRDALIGCPVIRRLARKGISPEDLAAAAAPLVELGYRTNGFAEAGVRADGSTVVIQEGLRRTWSELVVSAPTPMTEALATALLREPTARSTGLPITATRDLQSTDTEGPYWEQGRAAHFEPNFGGGVCSRLERGWASSARPKPTVTVSVEPVGADAARCVVTVTEPAPVCIATVQVDGAVANAPQDILAWLDHHTGIRPGAPADPALVSLACLKLEDTGRFLSVTAKLGDGGAVTVSVTEHPLLPLLNAELTDWQKRWLDIGEQMRRLYETGPGVVISARNTEMRLAAGLRLSRSHGISLRVGSGAPGAKVLELLMTPDRCGLMRPDMPLICCRFTKGGLFGSLGILPADNATNTLSVSAQIGFSTTRSGGMLWTCAPAALLATAGRTWTEVPGKPGTWTQKDEKGDTRFSATWDSTGAWRSWDLGAPDAGISLAPAEPQPAPAEGQDCTGPDLWREVLREPSKWLQTYVDQSWAEIPLGLAAAVATPAAALWPAGAPDNSTRLEFSIPDSPVGAAPEPQAQMAQIGAALGVVADALGSAIGPRAWPTLLCAGAGAALENDMAGFSALVGDLTRSGGIGPLGCLLEARLLRIAHSPSAAHVAEIGLKACTAERAWADITTCTGSEDFLVRWVLAIDPVHDAVRLAPVALRAGIAADLNAIRSAAGADRKALLATAFTRWWNAGLGDLVTAELERIAHPKRHPEMGIP